MSSGILNHPIIGHCLDCPKPQSMSYFAIQLAATYLALDLRLSFRSLRTDYDLRIVYACDLSTTVPSITASDDGESIDLYQVLHIRNFWKRHLTNPDEDTFYRTYHNLPKILRPKTWEEGLGSRESLGICWLGYYCTYLFSILVHVSSSIPIPAFPFSFSFLSIIERPGIL